MSLTVGEVEATLRLKDEMSPALHEAGTAVHDFGEKTSIMGGIMEDVFGSWPAKVAEGVLLRDMVHELIDRVKEGAVEFAITGSEVNTAHEALVRLAGGTEEATGVIEKMKDGVKGTIDELELMTRANKLLATGAVDSADQLGTLSEASRVLSREGFGPIPGLLDTISNAMQTGRTQRLGMSGLTVDATGFEARYAASLGKTTDELSRSQKLHADRMAVMAAAGKVIEQAGVQELNLKERIENTRNSIKNWIDDLAATVAASPHVTAAYDAIQQAFITAFGGDSKTIADEFLEWVNSAADAVKEYGPQVVQWLKDMRDWLVNIWHSIEQVWDKVPDWFKNVARDALLASLAIIVAKDGVKLLAESMGGLSDEGGNAVGTMANLAQIWSVAAGPLVSFGGQIKLLGEMIAGYGWAGFRLVITSWADAMAAATIGPVAGLIKGMWAAAAAIDGVALSAAATAALITGGLVIAIAALYQIGKAAYELFMLWRQSREAEADKVKQEAVDTANLARINATLGTSYKDLKEATKAADEYSANLRNSGTDLEKALRKVGSAVGDITNGMIPLARNIDDGSDKVTKHAKAVKEWTDSMTEGSKKMKVVEDGFAGLTGAELLDGETLERLIPEIDKLANAHVPLTQRMKDTYNAALDAKAAFEAKEKALLSSQGITLLYIEDQKELGLSEQNIATKLGVSVGALKEYEKELTEALTRIKDFRKVGEEGAAAVAKGFGGMPLVLTGLAESTGQASDRLRLVGKDVAVTGALVDTTYSEAAKAIAKSLDDAKSNHLVPLNDEQKKLIHAMDDAGVTSEEMARVMGISLKRVEDETGTLGKALKTDLVDVLKSIPQTVANAFTGGGGLMGAMSAIGTQLGSVVGKDLGESVGKMVGGTLGKLGGPIGAAIGSLAGPLIEAFFKLFDHVGDDVSRDAAQKFGTKFGKATTDAIVKAVKGGMTEVAAELSNLSSIIADAGGLNPKNLDTFTARLHDVFSMIDTGQLTVAQGTKIINDNWKAFTDAATSNVGVLNKAMVDLIHLQQSSGNEAAATTAYVQAQGTAAATALGDAFSVWPKAKQDLADVKAKMADIDTQQAALIKSGKQLTPEFEKLSKDWDVLKQQSKDLAGLMDATNFSGKSMGASVAGSYAAMIAGGMSAHDALAAIGPAVEGLDAQLQATGTDGGAAFNMLKGQINLAKDAVAGPAIDAVNNLTLGMTSLSNAGQLTQDEFSDFGGSVRSTFDSLVQQGKDGGAVMLAMQPSLQRLWEEEQQFGLKVDDSTQALIDEAEKAGVVGEKHKSSTDQMIDALGILHTDLMGIVSALTGKGGVSDAFTDLGKNAKAALDNIPKKVTIEVDHHNTSSGEDDPRAIPMASGGEFIVTKPTLFLAGEAGPERASFSGANKASGNSGTDSGGHWTILRDQIADLNRRMPFMLALAIKDALIQAGI